MLAMLDLGAVKIEGIGAVHADLENRFLYQIRSRVVQLQMIITRDE